MVVLWYTLFTNASQHVLHCIPLAAALSNRAVAMLKVEDDGSEVAEIAETGYRDADGEKRRPWCPATRILEHRESEAQELEAERMREAQKSHRPTLDEPKPEFRENFPDIKVFRVGLAVHVKLRLCS